MVHDVCIFDLDRPWEEFKVTAVPVPVVYMRWDPSGSRLLIVNAEGTFTVWVMEVGYFCTRFYRLLQVLKMASGFKDGRSIFRLLLFLEKGRGNEWPCAPPPFIYLV